MKYLIYILLFLLVGVVSKAQTPLPQGVPVQLIKGLQEAYYHKSDSGTFMAVRDTAWLPRWHGMIILWEHAGVDTALWVYYGKWNKLALQSGVPVNTNIANASLTANGNYTQNWNNNNLRFNSIKGLFFNTSGSLSTVAKSASIYSDPSDFDDIPFMIMLKTFKNGLPSSDSLRNFIRETSGQLEIRAINFINNKQSGLVLSQHSINMTAFKSGLTSSNYISIDTTNIHIAGAQIASSADSVYAVGPWDNVAKNNILYKVPFPSVGSGTVTSVQLSMPSAFTVTSSPITTSGTINVIGAGTSLQYIRGNGTLATFDTSAIPSFSAKVRSLFSGASPITYNQSSGAFGILDATATQKGAASFNASHFTVSSAAVSLSDVVTAGSCTNCTVSFTADGRAASFSTGSSGGNTNSNIGSGYRWAVPNTNNIKTVFNSNTIAWDSTSNTNGLTPKVDTSVISTIAGLDDSLISYEKVYNIISFGAIGDGKKVLDAAISASSSTLTSATANFTAADVGKAIRVPYAAAAGVDLITTIAGFTNSTTITLTASASTTVSADTVVWGTDNTAYIQAALDTCYHYGGGTVYIPNGVTGPYIIAGALRTSVNGINPNCQIFLPASYFGAAVGENNSPNRTHILIEGETAPNYTSNALVVDTVPSWKGTILYSLINGSGNAPAMFGTKTVANTAGDSINYNYFSFKNITILVSKNRNGGGPSIGGINGYYTAAISCEDVMVTFDGGVVSTVKPINEIAGIISSKAASETMTTFRRTRALGFKYGICLGEHTNADQIEAYNCDKGFVMLNNTHAAQCNRLLSTWNISDIYKPTTNILGLPNSGGSQTYINIDELDVELYDGDAPAPGWYNHYRVINDTSNLIVGNANYHVVKAGCCVDNSLFNRYAGGNLSTVQLGKPAFKIDNGATGDISNTNTGNVNIAAPEFNVSAPTTLIQGQLYTIFGNVGFGTTNVTFPLTRTGLLVKAQTSDGVEILAQPDGAGGSSGTVLFAGGTDGALVNRLAGNLSIGTNGSVIATLHSNGNFGINNSSPSSNFHVIGTTALDGVTTVTGTTANQLSVIGNNAGRTSIYVQNANSGGNASFYFENDRGSFGTYGGLLTGGSADGAGSLFGLTRADKTFLIHDGANGLGMAIGTLINQPFVLGTNNIERIRIAGSGPITFNSAYTFPTADGSSGQVLQTNGSGILSFQTPAGATTIYNGDGSISSNRSVTLGSSNLTFDASSSGDLSFTLGSDANYDFFYRNSSGKIARLGASTDGYVLTTHSTSSAPTWELPNYESGTYTPTITNGTNVSASTAYQCQYSRVGSVVTVSGKIDIDPTSTGATDLAITLPISSAVPNDFELAGTGIGVLVDLQAAIRADTVNDKAQFVIVLPATASTANNSWYFTFVYLIDNS